MPRRERGALGDQPTGSPSVTHCKGRGWVPHLWIQLFMRRVSGSARKTRTLFPFTPRLPHFAIEPPSLSVFPCGFAFRHGDQGYEERGRGETLCVLYPDMMRGQKPRGKRTETWGGIETQERKR